MKTLQKVNPRDVACDHINLLRMNVLYDVPRLVDHQPFHFTRTRYTTSHAMNHHTFISHEHVVHLGALYTCL